MLFRSQAMKARNGAYVREKFFGKYPETQKLVSSLSDKDIWRLNRGGHDPHKVFAAYDKASKNIGSPTVVIAKTIKGYGMGKSGESVNTTHQQKKLDEEDLLYLLESNLRDLGMKPISTSSGYEALEIYRQNLGSIQAVYLDLKMPGMGGMEVFYKLKQIHDDVRVILLTGYHKDRYVDRLLREGAIGYLLKPFSNQEVRNSLDLLFQPTCL